MECLAAHSGLMPANLTTLAHFWVSSAMSVPKAREHALGAYKICWGDGAPFHHHWPLEMPAGPTAVGEPEPQLPSVDPPTVKPFDFEADVERLIEKTLAERSEREEKAKPESKKAST